MLTPHVCIPGRAISLDLEVALSLALVRVGFGQSPSVPLRYDCDSVAIPFPRRGGTCVDDKGWAPNSAARKGYEGRSGVTREESSRT